MKKRVCSINIKGKNAQIAIFTKKGKSYKLEEFFVRTLEELPLYLKAISYPTYVSFSPRGILFAENNFPITKPKFLELNLRKNISETGMFEEAFIIRHKILSKNPPYQKINYFALPLSERERILSYLAPETYRLESLLPAQVPFAYYLSSFISRLSCGIYPTDTGYEIVFFEGSSIFYTRSIILPDTGDRKTSFLDALGETLTYFKQTYKRSPENIYLADDSYKESIERALKVKVLNIDFSHLVDKPLSQNETFYLPILLGNITAPPQYNLLEPTYLSEILARKWTKRLSVGALSISLALLFLAGYLFLQITKKQKFYAELSNKIKQDVAKIVQIQPSDEELQKLEKFIELYKAFQKQPKIDEFLVWLSTHYPARAVIVSMVAEPMLPPQKAQEATLQESQPPLEKTQSIPKSFNSLKISFTGEMIGSYEEARREFYNFISELQKNWEVISSQFTYHESSGVFNVVINYRGENYEGS